MPDASTLTPRGTPVSAPHIPTRSSKVSEKLVLLPRLQRRTKIPKATMTKRRTPDRRMMKR
jgi:hypothetical protein